MNKISNVDLFDINDELSVDTNLNKFLDMLNNIYNECFPIRRKKVSLKRLSNPWLTPGLLRSIDRCHKLNILYRNGVLQRCSFVKYRNKLTRLIKTQKSAFYKEKFNKCQKDIKTTWNNINKLLHANKSKANLSFNLDNINYDTPEDICKAFKDYFSSVSKKLNESIGKTHVTFDKFLRDSPSSSFFVNPSSSVEVERIMASMKNKNAPITDIPSKIYKLAADKLSYFISRLFNQSVQQGAFPQYLKIARIVPIHKDGDTSNIKNYRPISILPFISKIFEKLMLVRLDKYFEVNNVLNDKQFGFRHDRGTSDALTDFLTCIYDAFNSDKYTLCAFIDFKKTFDTVPHDILISKLNHYGVRGCTLKWFESYLSDRKMFVNYNGVKSTDCDVIFGVPQGTVLGPFLFLLYINDILNSTTVLRFLLYADDTTIFYSGKN